MRKCLLALALAIPCSAHGQWLDRVVASVNGAPILWSDVEQEIRIESLMNGQKPDAISPEQRANALDRLIDAVLLQQQIRQAHARVNSEQAQREVEKAEDAIRTEHNAAEQGAWQRLLNEYGLSQVELERYLKRQAEVLEFIELRFRPGLQIPSQQVQKYYDTTFVPEMRRRNASVPPLSSVRQRIERILEEREIDAAMSEWLKVVRASAEIWQAESSAKLATEPAGGR
jgi:SurA N-terminal domain